MKKLIAALLMLTMTISLCACGGGKESKKEDAPKNVMSNDYITINGIAVDDSYRDEDESPLRIVYLFYTLTAKDSNLKIDSIYTNMTIGETNTYEAEHIPGICEYASNYYYSSYIEEVYIGESLDVVATFKVPTGDLDAGKKITLSDSQIPDLEGIYFMTDDIQHFDGAAAVAEAMDPEGYQEAMMLREEADAERCQEVKSMINGYYWSFYVNYTSYELEFWAEDNFEVRTAFGANGGKYSIRNGYIFCTYDSNGAVVEIPYTIENGELSLDVTGAFDVKEN